MPGSGNKAASWFSISGSEASLSQIRSATGAWVADCKQPKAKLLCHSALIEPVSLSLQTGTYQCLVVHPCSLSGSSNTDFLEMQSPWIGWRLISNCCWHKRMCFLKNCHPKHGHSELWQTKFQRTIPNSRLLKRHQGKMDLRGQRRQQGWENKCRASE